MASLKSRDVATALVEQLRAGEGLRAELLASTDLTVDQKLTSVLRLSAARTSLIERVREALLESPRAPGAARFKSGADSGAAGSPGNDLPAINADIEIPDEADADD